jgi:hypothetical protein
MNAKAVILLASSVIADHVNDARPRNPRRKKEESRETKSHDGAARKNNRLERIQQNRTDEK